MSVWNPTHVQFTVLRARNLIAKGKGGNNDVFVTIQLGKEKYQTSTIKNALHPEWFEECDLPIPYMQAEIEVTLYHRGVLSDDFLGYSSIPLWQHKISDSNTSRWVSLRNKPTSKSDDSKYRGELEVKLTFHCESRNDINPHGLKKRPNSIRNIAQAFGDKLKFSRSRSFRENRKDPEGGKLDKTQPMGGADNTNGLEGVPGWGKGPPFPKRPLSRGPAPPPLPPPMPVHFSALDISRGAPWLADEDAPDNLTRSYSLSSAYIKSMTLERSKLNNSGLDTPDGYHRKSFTPVPSADKQFQLIPSTEAGVSQIHSQSMYNLPGNRRSYVEIPTCQSSGYSLHYNGQGGLSKDDSVLYATPAHRRSASDQPAIPSSASFPAAPPPSGFEVPPRGRDPRSGIYESIKERTEPENSGSTSSDPESVPKPRNKRYSRREVPVMGSSSRDYGKGLASSRNLPSSSVKDTFMSSTGHRDSGIVEDRSSNSRDGSIATQDGSVVPPSDRISSSPAYDHPPGQGKDADPSRDPGSHPLTSLGMPPSVGHRQFNTLPSLGHGGRESKKLILPSQFYTRENGQGELVVRKRSRGERDRLRQIRQGNRRFTVQGLDHHQSGLYDDSSDHSDSSRTEVPEDLLSVYKNMTKEELLRVVIQTKAQMIRKDQYIKDLEKYIDDLLVRVMETTPRLLSRTGVHRI